MIKDTADSAERNRKVLHLFTFTYHLLNFRLFLLASNRKEKRFNKFYAVRCI